MTRLTYEIGQKIKSFRNKKNMTLQELAAAIHKSKATVSKYESGQIVIDIVTLYDISKALDVHVEQLLYSEPIQEQLDTSNVKPSFFKGLSRFYAYMFDGRTNLLTRCVVDIRSKSDNNQYKVMMYMNIDSYENYENCENTYWGYVKHFDALSNIILYNQDTPMEQITISILASYLDSPTKWGLFFGISSRPLMPVATKILLSKKILPETSELIKKLRISREDIRILKMYNMMTIT